MTVTPVTLIKGDKNGSETDYRDQLPVNMYPVLRPILGAQGYMIAYPGLTQIAAGPGIDRGGVYNERQLNQYRISGTELISVEEDGVVSNLGSVTGSEQVALPYSFNTQAVIANGRYYLYDTTTGFREVTDSDLGDPIDAVWVDGYYFFTDGENIYHTDIDDEESIDPLKFATAEFMPDPSLGVAKTQDNKVMVFGRYTLEYFVNDASDNFSFSRVETRAQKIGIVATHAKCEALGKFYIVGGRKHEDVGVHAIGVGASDKISTREIDKIIGQYTEPQLSDIRMESRTEDDVTFLIIHLPGEVVCYVLQADAWIVLKTGFKDNVSHRAINGVFDARTGKWVYGDKRDGKIGDLDGDKFTQYDTEPQEWELYTPFLKIEKQSVDEIEIENVPGFNNSFISVVGIGEYSSAFSSAFNIVQTDQTTEDDANVFLSMTYNGVTYGTEVLTEYGSPGNYDQRFIKRRLGYVSDWVGFKFRGATRARMAFGLMRLTHG